MGSTDTTEYPSCVISALKLARPSPHPKILVFKSASDKLNINLYSSSVLPQGTTSFSFISVMAIMVKCRDNSQFFVSRSSNVRGLFGGS